MEKILCAAIHYDDIQKYDKQPCNIKSGFVVCGYRHENCKYQYIHLIYGFNRNKTEGFLTSENRFVDRSEAFLIATNADQLIDKENLKRGTMYDELSSEDLY